MWLDETEGLRGVEERLKRIRAREDKPASAVECAHLGAFCALYCKRYVEAIRFFDEASQRKPQLAIALRYRKGCAAIRAANGEGVDAPEPGARPELRRLALDLFRDDLALWKRSYPVTPPGLKAQMRKDASAPWPGRAAFHRVCPQEAERP
jgi:hypothetical protein